MHLFILQRLSGKELNKVFKQVLGWLIAAIFFFPIYFWITVSIKKDKDIFALPPKLFNFEVSFSAYDCLLYTSPSPRDLVLSRMPSSA